MAAADRNSALWKRLHQEACQVRAIDCHVHTYTEAEYEHTRTGLDLFTLLGYFARDISGLEEVHGLSLAQCKTDSEKWTVLRKVLDLAGNVTYYRHLWHVYRELYGLGNVELSDRNWRGVNQKIKQCSQRRDWYRQLIKRRAAVDLGVYNAPITPATSSAAPGVTVPRTAQGDFTVSSVGVVTLVTAAGPEPIRVLEKETDTTIRNAASVRDAIRRFLGIIKAEGAVAIKSQHAYSRTLKHERVSKAAATRALGKVIGTRGRPSRAELHQLQDFMFWTLCEEAGEAGLVFQIHTGIQSNWGRMADSDPRHLMEPIGACRKTRFDLFHAGYPFTIELGLMAKHYPNIWPNMAWMYVITMEGSRRTLNEWIDLVPGHRILGFGSDVGWPELVVGHASMARLCIADVLAAKVSLDLLTEARARHLIHQLLRDNAIELYGLQERSGLK